MANKTIYDLAKYMTRVFRSRENIHVEECREDLAELTYEIEEAIRTNSIDCGGSGGEGIPGPMGPQGPKGDKGDPGSIELLTSPNGTKYQISVSDEGVLTATPV